MSARASEVNPSPAIVKLRWMVGELRSLDTALAKQSRVVRDAVVLNIGREDQPEFLDLQVERHDRLREQTDLLTQEPLGWCRRDIRELVSKRHDLARQFKRFVSSSVNPVVQAVVGGLFKRHNSSPVNYGDGGNRDTDPSVGEARDGADHPVSRRRGNPPDGGAA